MTDDDDDDRTYSEKGNAKKTKLCRSFNSVYAMSLTIIMNMNI